MKPFTRIGEMLARAFFLGLKLLLHPAVTTALALVLVAVAFQFDDYRFYVFVVAAVAVGLLTVVSYARFDPDTWRQFDLNKAHRP